MALPQSALSELLDAIRAGGSVDVMREAMTLVLQELIEPERSSSRSTTSGRSPNAAISPRARWHCLTGSPMMTAPGRWTERRACCWRPDRRPRHRRCGSRRSAQSPPLQGARPARVMRAPVSAVPRAPSVRVVISGCLEVQRVGGPAAPVPRPVARGPAPAPLRAAGTVRPRRAGSNTRR